MDTTSTSYRLPDTLLKRMAAFKADAGVNQTAQVIKGVSAWLDEQEKFRLQLRRSLMTRTGGAK